MSNPIRFPKLFPLAVLAFSSVVSAPAYSRDNIGLVECRAKTVQTPKGKTEIQVSYWYSNIEYNMDQFLNVSFSIARESAPGRGWWWDRQLYLIDPRDSVEKIDGKRQRRISGGSHEYIRNKGAVWNFIVLTLEPKTGPNVRGRLQAEAKGRKYDVPVVCEVNPEAAGLKLVSDWPAQR